jgi:hypothetical protein
MMLMSMAIGDENDETDDDEVNDQGWDELG